MPNVSKMSISAGGVSDDDSSRNNNNNNNNNDAVPQSPVMAAGALQEYLEELSLTDSEEEREKQRDEISRCFIEFCRLKNASSQLADDGENIILARAPAILPAFSPFDFVDYGLEYDNSGEKYAHKQDFFLTSCEITNSGCLLLPGVSYTAAVEDDEDEDDDSDAPEN